jgi:acyl-coenzyme A synthetase/AMP-(fatty) acid ligase
METGAVSEVVVFGLDDPALGQKVRALVILAGETTPQEILARCRAAAPYYLVPREVFAVANFPRTANGKIDRPRAIADSLEHHGA